MEILLKNRKKKKKNLLYDPAIPLLEPEKTNIQKIHEPQCSLQHYIQNPLHANNLYVHQKMNGQRNYSTYIQWNIIQP